MKEKELKLNFGCGNNIMEGWDNVDIQSEAPIVWDLNKVPYKFAKENIYDYVLISSVLEYLDKPEEALQELWRICKPNAKIEIQVPHYTNKASYNDMKSNHYFSERTFERIVSQPYQIKEHNGFKLIEKKINSHICWEIYPKMVKREIKFVYWRNDRSSLCYIGGFKMNNKKLTEKILKELDEKFDLTTPERFRCKAVLNLAFAEKDAQKDEFVRKLKEVHEDVKDTCRIIKNETRPIEGHDDPGALQDCWNLINENLDEIDKLNKEVFEDES